jgi:hypothetical protein
MLKEIIQHQYNVLLQSLFMLLLVRISLIFLSRCLGKSWNSVWGMVVLINVSSFAFFVYSVTCMQNPGSSTLGFILFYQTI